MREKLHNVRSRTVLHCNIDEINKSGFGLPNGNTEVTQVTTRNHPNGDIKKMKEEFFQQAVTLLSNSRSSRECVSYAKTVESAQSLV